MNLKYSGKPYINRYGMTTMGRSMRPPCNKTCRQNCWQKITECQRQRLFDEYYKLADLNRQRQYLGMYMDKTVPKQTSITEPRLYKYKVKSRPVVEPQRNRGSNIQYYLPTDTGRVKVCKTMFLATFDISQSAALTVVQKTDDQGIVQKDGRGGLRVQRQSKHDTDNQKQLDDSCSSSGMVDHDFDRKPS